MYRAYDDWSWGRGEPSRDRTTSSTPDARTVGLSGEWRVLVHPLVFCPPLGKGINYLLVKRAWPGQRNVLAAGRATSPHESLNLARVRHSAAKIGANEVHIISA